MNSLRWIAAKLSWKHLVGVTFLALSVVACNNSVRLGDILRPGDAACVNGNLRAGGIGGVVTGQFEVNVVDRVDAKRRSRTTCEYSYRVSIRNNGTSDAMNVRAIVSTSPAGTTIIKGEISAVSIGAGASAIPTDLVVLQADRKASFNLKELVWKITSTSVQQLDPVKPAEVVVISLADLGLPNGAEKVTVSGAVTDALLKDGTLRFSTPGDTGALQFSSFTLTSGGVTKTLSLSIVSERPAEPIVHVEPSEEGSSPVNLPNLSISGLGPNNSFVGNPVAFKLEGMPQMDLSDDSDGLITGFGNTEISLKNYWTFNVVDNSFTISGAKLQQLMAALPAGALTVSLNFVSKDGEFAASYELLAIGHGATLSGKLVTPQGDAVTGLAGKKMLLHGFNQRLRQVATIDNSGNFLFSNVIPDTYQLTLNDLDNPNVVSASTVIFQNTTTANVSIIYNVGGLSIKALTGSASSFTASKVKQDGTAPKARTLTRESRPRTTAATVTTVDDTAVFTATAEGQDATITTPISYVVPKGTQNIEVKATVFTEEYPAYTTQQSQFNDTWSYSVTGLPGTSLSGSGSVNQSHFTQGTVTKSICVDVSAQAKNTSFTIGGMVSATNIGDDRLATVTTIELHARCVGLLVSGAKFLTPNKDGHPVLQPVRLQGNLSGPYLSLPLNGTDATHTIPLEIQYSPADAQITEVNISVSADGASPNFASDNLLGQANTISNGKIKFSGISLPAFASAITSGKVVVTVRVKGKVQDTEVTSDPQEGGQVELNGETAFIPLYLANNESGLGGRRYGGRDAGGDSWATRRAISWLQSRSYRFDDISAQHVAQETTGRSILGHSGHSDGQQIDMRYADGQGGYSDALGGQGNGAAIKQMFNAARQEVITSAQQKPQLAALQAWITANRALLDTEAAANTTRVIYIGPSFIKLALVDAMFSVSPNLSIPGVSGWAKPARVSIDPAHLSHWHLSATAHP